LRFDQEQSTAWIRRLAGYLAKGGDPDELTQDTWLALLSNPPKQEGPLRRIS